MQHSTQPHLVDGFDDATIQRILATPGVSRAFEALKRIGKTVVNTKDRRAAEVHFNEYIYEVCRKETSPLSDDPGFAAEDMWQLALGLREAAKATTKTVRHPVPRRRVELRDLRLFAAL